MKVDLYERIWMWAVAAVLAGFFTVTAVGAIGSQHHPPSHVETIDPRTVMSDPRFRAQGLRVNPDGSLHVTVVGMMFVWLPGELTLPADTPVTFHMTAIDVIHGFQIVRTNGQAMVIPGYVSRFTTSFAEPGEYLIACNEYCGVGHHQMAAKLTVVPRDGWTPPGREATPVATSPSTEDSAHAAH